MKGAKGRYYTTNRALDLKLLAVELLIVRQLADDLRKPKYRGHKNPLHGHCYIASEAAYYMLGKEWQPYYMHLLSGDTHWFLKHKETKQIFDPTAGQFRTTPKYSLGHRCGFLTKQPSKRTLEILRRMENENEDSHQPALYKSQP